ncbi:adenylate cyclase [Candidatus Pacearchaeota archaeon ex4484_26]|nr:MAG: adenylate cyclase [Candidatus Pacearchaeota archaeon ex4484_26]
MSHINIEIKAKLRNQKRIKEILKSRNADFKGIDHQIDTYFNVNFGRLKLREGDIENYLIYYAREDKYGPKQSNVILHELNSDSPLKEILTKSLGVLVIVDKKREIYFIDNVKFHLDDVQGLGKFVEIEAIDKQGNIGKEELLEQCNFYLDLLKISEKDLISVSYSDLLLKNKEKASLNS